MSVTPGIRRYGKADADSVGRKTPGSAVMNRRKQILSTPLSSARKEATPNRFHLSKTDPAAAAVRNILFEEEEDEDDANTSWSSVDSQVSRHGHACASFLRSALHYYYHTLQSHSFFFLPVLTAFFSFFLSSAQLWFYWLHACLVRVVFNQSIIEPCVSCKHANFVRFFGEEMEISADNVIHKSSHHPSKYTNCASYIVQAAYSSTWLFFSTNRVIGP